MCDCPFPPVLILDEPTTGLDVYSRRLVLDTIREMNSEGSTILLTTHNIEEANTLCSMISVINRGRIVATESPERLKKTFFRSIIIVCEKNMRIYYFKGPVMVFGLLFPLIMFLTFFIGPDLDLIPFFPGFLGMMLFFTSSSVGPLITTLGEEGEDLREARLTPGDPREHHHR